MQCPLFWSRVSLKNVRPFFPLDSNEFKLVCFFIHQHHSFIGFTIRPQSLFELWEVWWHESPKNLQETPSVFPERWSTIALAHLLQLQFTIGEIPDLVLSFSSALRGRSDCSKRRWIQFMGIFEATENRGNIHRAAIGSSNCRKSIECRHFPANIR